ncbi:MAG: PEGA domain-containing protein [Myxococcota bacterium]
MTQQAAAPGAPREAEEVLPKRFGKYTLLRRLAVGGMAELFLALQKSVAGFEKLIVVKRVLPNLVTDKAFVEMLLQEARIAATLTHPNIAQVYDVGVVDGDYFIAMEHVHGEDLRSIVRQMKKKEVRSFPLEHTLAIILGCCKGLAYAHEKRDLDGNPLEIVHRDISPQNVLVTFTGDVKLVDFGIAKASTTGEEDNNKLKGKVPYMSPEQASGAVLDARSDLFSLGVMLFELCTGRRLFKGKDENDTLQIIIRGDYPTPRSINPALSQELERIILKALTVDRERRYNSAREMQADLETYIREAQLAVSPLSLGEWMQSLFDEKLAQQKQMLQEGRQLAEVIAAQIPEEEFTLAGTGVSAVRARPSKTPWVLLVTMLVLAIGGAVAAYLLWPDPPPTGPGVLVLASEPPGAAIWIDGERRSERTPATLSNLPVGTYEVKFTAEGYVPLVRSVELTESEPSLEVSGALARPSAAHFGVVQLRSTPAGATVLLDGREVEGNTPVTIGEVEPGTEHTLVVTLEGYETVTQTIIVEAGQVESLELPLERTPLGPNEALAIVTIEPDTARLVIDGDTHDEGSPYEIRLPAGNHRFVAVKTGYRTDSRELRLPGGETVELAFSLERGRTSGMGMGMSMGMTRPPPMGGAGSLTFDARPWCNVSIDGRRVGQTPIVNRSLPAGPHRITCTNPELNVTRNLSVTIEAGQPTRRRINLR